jgi:hypothetical protein
VEEFFAAIGHAIDTLREPVKAYLGPESGWIAVGFPDMLPKFLRPRAAKETEEEKKERLAEWEDLGVRMARMTQKGDEGKTIPDVLEDLSRLAVESRKAALDHLKAPHLADESAWIEHFFLAFKRRQKEWKEGWGWDGENWKEVRWWHDRGWMYLITLAVLVKRFDADDGGDDTARGLAWVLAWRPARAKIERALGKLRKAIDDAGGIEPSRWPSNAEAEKVAAAAEAEVRKAQAAAKAADAALARMTAEPGAPNGNGAPEKSRNHDPPNTTDPCARRDKVFISYSHKDKSWLKLLKDHLEPYQRHSKLSVWDDSSIKPGEKWREEIRRAIATAKVAVLLVSPSFLASDFIAEHELPPLLNAAGKKGMTILWIPVSSSSYSETEIGEYQAACDPAKPLRGLSPAKRDEALVDICKKIKAAMESA